VQKIWDTLARFIVRFSRWIIAGVILLVAAVSLFIPRLRFENDMTYWVDPRSPLGRMPHYINDRFGNNTPLLVVVDFGDVFQRRNLESLDEFARELEQLPDIDSQTSLATVDEVVPTDEGILVQKLISYPLPADPGYLDELRSKVLATASYVGRIVSRDGSTAMIIVKPVNTKESDQAAREVRAIAKRVFPPEARLYFSGSPFILFSMAEIVLADFVILIPLVSVLVIGIMFLSFRTLRGVVLPLVTVLFSSALTMGLMAVFRVPLNILSSAVPVILIAVGSAYGIHVLSSYYENATILADPRDIVARAIREVGLPVLMAGLTTIGGFVSNVTAQVSVIKTFGLFTAVGVALTMVIALLFIPALLLHLKVPVRRPRAPSMERAAVKIGNISRTFSRLFVKHKYVVIAVFAALGIVVFLFSFRITSKVDMLGYFSPDAEPNVASRFVNERFGGFSPLNVYLKADLQDPDVLKVALMLEERIKAYGSLSAPNGLPDVLCEINHAMTGQYTIPETKKEVQELWFFVEGEKMLESIVSEEKDDGLVTVLLPTYDNEQVNALFQHLQAFLDEYKGGFPVVANTPGNPHLTDLEALMIANLARSRGGSLSPEEARAVVERLAAVLEAADAAIDRQRIVDYVTSDEAEILLSNAQALALADRLARSPSASATDVAGAIEAVLRSSADAEEVEGFARSIAALVEEGRIGGALQAMDRELRALRPELAAASPAEANYALAPFFWKSIPAPRSALAAAPLRTVAMEDFQLTGSAYLVEQTRKNVFANQVSSLAIALAAVLVLNTLTFGSLLEGIISLCAIVFTIMVNFGIMGIFRIPLDFATAIIASVAVGTGIDYTIHFITRYTRELQAAGGDMETAYQATISTTGRAIAFNALSVGLGFAVLLVSKVIPMRTAGLLLAITMLTSSAATMTLLPAVLAATNALPEKIAGMRKTKKEAHNG